MPNTTRATRGTESEGTPDGVGSWESGEAPGEGNYREAIGGGNGKMDQVEEGLGKTRGVEPWREIKGQNSKDGW